jgi:transcription initiation factor TFIIIB Brf1 subunit/transcription initiation factor TFIIB
MPPKCCFSSDPQIDPDTGDKVCTACGAVLESTPYRNSLQHNPSRVTEFNGRKTIEKSSFKYKYELMKLLNSVQIPNSICEIILERCKFLLIQTDKRIGKVQMKTMFYCCLYLTLKEYSIAISLSFILENVERRKFWKMLKFVQDNVKLKVAYSEPMAFMGRICQGLDDKVEKTALKLYGILERSDIDLKSNPEVVATSLVCVGLEAVRAAKLKVKEFCEICEITSASFASVKNKMQMMHSFLRKQFGVKGKIYDCTLYELIQNNG